MRALRNLRGVGGIVVERRGTSGPSWLVLPRLHEQARIFPEAQAASSVGDLEADDSNQRGRYMTPEATLPDSAETSGDVRYTLTEVVSGVAAGGAVHAVTMFWIGVWVYFFIFEYILHRCSANSVQLK